jgi:hypothetical protein
MNLQYKTLGGDILVFKGKDTMTIHRGCLGIPWVYSVEIDGEEADMLDKDFVNPFTEEEEDYFTDLYRYSEIVGPNY